MSEAARGSESGEGKLLAARAPKFGIEHDRFHHTLTPFSQYMVT